MNDDFVSVMAIFVLCELWELFGVNSLLFDFISTVIYQLLLIYFILSEIPHNSI